MKNYRCAIFGQNTICFKWGFDEDDEYCIAMKQELLQKIMELRQQDVTQFYTACDHGASAFMPLSRSSPDGAGSRHEALLHRAA